MLLLTLSSFPRSGSIEDPLGNAQLMEFKPFLWSTSETNVVVSIGNLNDEYRQFCFCRPYSCFFRYPEMYGATKHTGVG